MQGTQLREILCLFFGWPSWFPLFLALEELAELLSPSGSLPESILKESKGWKSSKVDCDSDWMWIWIRRNRRLNDCSRLEDDIKDQ